MWLISIILTDASLHVAIPLTESSSDMRSRHGLRVPRPALCGLALSPPCFSETLKAALAPLGTQGIQILAYLVDMTKQQAI